MFHTPNTTTTTACLQPLQNDMRIYSHRLTPKNIADEMSGFELGIGAPIYDLLTAIADRAALANYEEVKIKVTCSLFPASYTGNPAMLTRMMQAKISGKFPFVVVEKPKDKRHFVITFSVTHRPATFRAAALLAVSDTGIFRVARESVPMSYRVQPSLFTRILCRMIAKPVACITSEASHLTWRI